MRKILFQVAITLIVLPCMAQTSTDKKDIVIAPDTSISAQQELKLDAEIQQALLKKLNEKGDWWESSLVSLLASIIFSGAAVWFSWSTFSRDKKYKDLEFIAEVDKMLLEHPELWAYEDTKRKEYESGVEVTTPASITITGTEKLFFKNSFSCLITALGKDVNVSTSSGFKRLIKSGSPEPVNGSTDTELIIENIARVDIISDNGVVLQSLNDKLWYDKINAFLYYKLNNFEMALKQQSDKVAMECWEEYLVYLYKRSTPFYNIIQNILKNKEYGKIYNQDFVKQIEKTLIKKCCVV